MICNMITQWLPQDLKLSQNICGIQDIIMFVISEFKLYLHLQKFE